MAFLAAAAPALGLLGAGVSAIGSVMGGEATANAASYNAQIAANNAKIAKQNAEYSAAAGSAKTEQQGLQAAEQLGAVKTSLAANGIDVNTGSALDVEKGQREVGLLNEQTTMNNAELQAYGYQTQAAGFTAQSSLDTMEAQTAPIGADIGAAGGLLGNASSIGFRWGQTTGSSASTTADPASYGVY